jgi:hypothetical protein
VIDISAWAIAILILFAALPLSCVRSAKSMPPESGEIAGWLRWYAGCYGFYAVFFLSTSVGGNQAAIIGALMTLPFAIAVWLRSPAARGVNLYGNFALALLCVPLAISGEPELWTLVLSCALWGAYFVRSQRVAARYALIE